VKINVHDIEEVEKDLVYEEPTADLGKQLRHGDVSDFDFPAATQVEIAFHRTGDELFFRGHVASRPIGHCARCLEDYEFELETDFNLVMMPKTPEAIAGSAEDLDLSFYDGEEIDLSPAVREQLILALPTRPLCREDCRGLCSQCGANRNQVDCGCTQRPVDVRLAVLRNLTSPH